MKLRNRFHKEHRVEFPDNSEDNNNSEDIDGQEIVLLNFPYIA